MVAGQQTFYRVTKNHTAQPKKTGNYLLEPAGQQAQQQVGERETDRDI